MFTYDNIISVNKMLEITKLTAIDVTHGFKLFSDVVYECSLNSYSWWVIPKQCPGP